MFNRDQDRLFRWLDHKVLLKKGCELAVKRSALTAAELMSKIQRMKMG